MEREWVRKGVLEAGFAVVRLEVVHRMNLD